MNPIQYFPLEEAELAYSYEDMEEEFPVIYESLSKYTLLWEDLL